MAVTVIVLVFIVILAVIVRSFILPCRVCGGCCRYLRTLRVFAIVVTVVIRPVDMPAHICVAVAAVMHAVLIVVVIAWAAITITPSGAQFRLARLHLLQIITV